MEKRKFILKCGLNSTEGSEARIFQLKDGIYKEFKDSVSLKIRKRKKERLLYLERFEHLKQYYPNIKYYVEYLLSWYLKGYVMEEIDDIELWSSRYSFEEKMKYLGMLKDILELFRESGLCYYDIHLGNVRISKNGIPLLLDIDSILFEDEKEPDCKPDGLDEYRRHGGQLDKSFQIIKFNNFTRSVLIGNSGMEYDEVGKEMIPDRVDLYRPHSIYSQEYLYQHIKK